MTLRALAVYLPARMPWWLWMVLGFTLLLAEIAVPSDFFLCFFGLAAIVVGALLGIGLDGPAWLPWLLFALLSIVAVLTLRSPLRERLTRPSRANTGDHVTGEVVRLLDALAPGEIGRAELRGSVWRVRSRAAETLPAGSYARVERVDGLTLWVLPAERTSGDTAPRAGGSA